MGGPDVDTKRKSGAHTINGIWEQKPDIRWKASWNRTRSKQLRMDIEEQYRI